MLTVMLDKRATPEHLGLIPSFLNPADPRPAAQQLDANYQHGGGWRPQSKFTMDFDRWPKQPKGPALQYPGDPPMYPFAMILLRNETIFIYRYGYVAVVQPGGAFEACRLD